MSYKWLAGRRGAILVRGDLAVLMDELNLFLKSLIKDEDAPSAKRIKEVRDVMGRLVWVSPKPSKLKVDLSQKLLVDMT